MSAEDNLEMHKLEDIAEEDFTNDSKAEVPNEIDPLIQDTEVEVVTELVSESITGPTIEIITEAIIHSEHAEDIESDDSSEIKETLSPLKHDSTDKLKPILKNTTTLPKVTFESNVGYEDKSPEGQINVENGSQSKSKHFNLPTFVGQEANFEGRPSIPNDYDSLKRKRSSIVIMRNWRRQSQAFVRRSSSRLVSWAIPRSSFRFSHESTDGGLYERKISLWPPPVMMITITIVQIVLYALEHDIVVTFPGNKSKRDIYSKLNFDPCKRMEFYRYISHILVHSTLGHLAVNMVLQVSLGVALEIAHGWWRVLSIYLFGILGGILGKLLFVPYSGLCGASAGCYALLLAHIANVMMNWKDMEFGVPQLFIYALFSVTDITMVCFSYFLTENKSDTSVLCHLFGALSGLLVGFVILRILTDFDWQKQMGQLAFILFLMFLIVGLSFQFFKPFYHFCMPSCNNLTVLWKNYTSYDYSSC